MTEQEAKELVRLYNEATGENYSINGKTDSEDAQIDTSQDDKISRSEFNQLTAKEQREYYKNEHKDVIADKQNFSLDEEKAVKLEAYKSRDEYISERAKQKDEQKREAKQRQEEQRERPKQNIQYAAHSDSSNNGLDGRKIDIIISLLEKIAQNTSMGLS